MNEKLLQYLWNYKIFKSFDFTASEGTSIEILDFGKWNFDSGPDFLMAKIKINGLVLVGNIELHVKSSDWIFHNHSGNPEFENLILHAVFQHDVEIEELKSKNIPTLELQNFLDENAIQNYQKIIANQNFIACENVFDAKKIPFGFFEESLLKKLNKKSLEIEYSLQKFQNNSYFIIENQIINRPFWITFKLLKTYSIFILFIQKTYIALPTLLL